MTYQNKPYLEPIDRLFIFQKIIALVSLLNKNLHLAKLLLTESPYPRGGEK